MTAMHQTATSTRNLEPDTKSANLDLALDSINLLRRHRKLSITDLTGASKFRGWLESSSSEGERWLRNRAQDGDVYAMEKLGRRLLTGDGLPKSVEEGLVWLKKSAELGNPFAMERLGEYEFDESQTPDSSAEGERWLRNAVQLGNRVAAVNLGTRLITANGLEPD